MRLRLTSAKEEPEAPTDGYILRYIDTLAMGRRLSY